MASYVEFQRVLAREGKPRRFSYVCGREGVLVEEAVDAIRRGVAAESMNRVTLFAGEDSPGSIWTEMAQYALEPTMPRLVTVRNAQRLTGWEKFEPWLMGSRAAKAVHVLMVAEEPEWPSDRCPEAKSRMVKSSQAVYVQCEIPKSDPYVAAAKVVRAWAPWMPERIAVHLAQRVGADMARCRDVCRWLELLDPPGPLSTRMIDSLSSVNAQESFVGSVVRMDKATAFQVVGEVGSSSGVLGKLASRMNQMDRIHRALRVTLSSRDRDRDKAVKDKLVKETAAVSGLPYMVVREWWPYAKHYDPAGVTRRTELLCLADEYRNDAGVLEMVVSQW